MSQELKHGWFTQGTVTFMAENERKDGKGSFLTVYIRFGADKGAVTKAKVWSKAYRTLHDGWALHNGEGFVQVEVGMELTAWGTLSSYKVEGNERIGYVIEAVSGSELGPDMTLSEDELEAKTA